VHCAGLVPGEQETIVGSKATFFGLTSGAAPQALSAKVAITAKANAITKRVGTASFGDHGWAFTNAIWQEITVADRTSSAPSAHRLKWILAGARSCRGQ
jgi:hypothetical protein